MLSSKAENNVPDESQTAGEKYSCSDCGKIFRKPSLLRRHEVVHATTKPFRCVDCNKFFTQKSSLQRHYAHSHKGERKHKCPKCKMSFSQKVNLVTHLQRTHLLQPYGNDKNISFACKQCPCIFTKLNTLNRHKSLHRVAEEYAQEQLVANLHDDAASLAKNVLAQLKELNSGMQQQYEDLEIECVENYVVNCKQIDEPSQPSLLETTIEDKAATDIVILSDKLNMSGEVNLVSVQRITRANGLIYYVCEFCAKEFKKKYDFLRHRRIHTNECPYKCIYCESSFKTKAKRNEHSKIHILDEKIGALKKQHLCVICEKNYKSMRQLDMHMRSHSNSHTVQYSCSDCHATYSTKTAFSTHKHKIVDKEFKMLQKFLPDPINLTSSEKQLTYYPQKQEANEKCHLKFVKCIHLTQLETNGHSSPRNFKCACGRCFISKSDFNVHGKIHNSTTNNLTYQNCPQRRFTTRAELQRHSLVVHTTSNNFKCPYCAQTFKTKQYCRSHMKVHLKRLLNDSAEGNIKDVQSIRDMKSAAKASKCQVISSSLLCSSSKCTEIQMPATSNQQHTIQNAEEITSKQCKEVPKNTCQFCCKTFRKLNDLQRHLRTHNQTTLNRRRPFPCDICGKSFALKSTLNYHLSTHASSRITHECQVCGKRYAAKKVLNIHLRLHTGKCQLFQCNFCERSFRTSGHRISHMRAAHSRS